MNKLLLALLLVSNATLACEGEPHYTIDTTTTPGKWSFTMKNPECSTTQTTCNCTISRGDFVVKQYSLDGDVHKFAKPYPKGPTNCEALGITRDMMFHSYVIVIRGTVEAQVQP